MKVTLTFLIAIAICFQPTQSFLGFPVNFKAASKISSGCIKASSSVEGIPTKTRTILKVILQFKTEEYSTLSTELSNLEHFSNGLLTFLNMYSTFINEPPIGNPKNIATLLVYNAQLMESATEQISFVPKSFADVFGDSLQEIMETLIIKLGENIMNIRVALEEFQVNIDSVLDSGNDISVETLESEINTEAIDSTLLALQETFTAGKQINGILSALLSVTRVVESSSASITKTTETAQAAVSQMTFTLNVEAQSAKTKYVKHTTENIQLISQSFASFEETASKVFSNTTSEEFQAFLLEQLKSVDEHVSLESEMLIQTQAEFTKRIQEYYIAMRESIQETQKTITTEEERIKNYFGELVVQNSGAAFKICLNPKSEVQQQSVALIKFIQSEFTSCFMKQRTTTIQAQDLASFILGDVTYGQKGAADSLCGCSVKGGKKILGISTECISTITNDLPTELSKDQEYLTTELDKISETLEKSQIRFTQCTGKITESYEIQFEQFQTAALACMASTRSLI